MELTYAGVKWFRHRNQQADRVADSCGFQGVCVEWVFCIGSDCVLRLVYGIASARPAERITSGSSRPLAMEQPSVVASPFRVRAPLTCGGKADSRGLQLLRSLMPLLTASMRSWGHLLCRGAMHQT